jgi:hypothetical protein
MRNKQIISILIFFVLFSNIAIALTQDEADLLESDKKAALMVEWNLKYTNLFNPDQASLDESEVKSRLMPLWQKDAVDSSISLAKLKEKINAIYKDTKISRPMGISGPVPILIGFGVLILGFAIVMIVSKRARAATKLFLWAKLAPLYDLLFRKLDREITYLNKVSSSLSMIKKAAKENLDFANLLFTTDIPTLKAESHLDSGEYNKRIEILENWANLTYKTINSTIKITKTGNEFIESFEKDLKLDEKRVASVIEAYQQRKKYFLDEHTFAELNKLQEGEVIAFEKLDETRKKLLLLNKASFDLNFSLSSIKENTLKNLIGLISEQRKEYTKLKQAIEKDQNKEIIKSRENAMKVARRIHDNVEKDSELIQRIEDIESKLEENTKDEKVKKIIQDRDSLFSKITEQTGKYNNELAEELSKNVVTLLREGKIEQAKKMMIGLRDIDGDARRIRLDLILKGKATKKEAQEALTWIPWQHKAA